MADDEISGFVVFHGDGAYRKPGFGHCFVVFSTSRTILRADGYAGLPSIDAIGRIGTGDIVSLAVQYANTGTVVPFASRPEPIRWPFLQSTCVGMTKALIGIRNPFIFTPYQLYKYLTRRAQLEVYKPGTSCGSIPAVKD